MLRSAWMSCSVALCLALTGCQKDPGTPEYWEAALNDAHRPAEKVNLLEKLGNSHLTPAMLPLLNGRLGAERSPQTRAAIARLLGQLKDRSSVEPLISAIDLSSSASDVHSMNREVVGALASIGDPRAIAALMPMLKSGDAFTQIDVIDALGKLKATQAVEPLMAITNDAAAEPLGVRRAILALGDIGDTKAVPLLVRMLYQERGPQSFYPESAFALFVMGKPAVDALVPVLKGDSPHITGWARENHVAEAALYSKAAQVLGDLDDARAEEALIERLRFQAADPAQKLLVRMMAANALGRMHSKAGAHALEGMVDETEPMARGEYLRALTLAGGDETVAAIVRAAAKGPFELRELNVAAISLLAPDTTAIEKLRGEEAKLTQAECKQAGDADECQDVAALTQKREKTLQAYEGPVQAAMACKADTACWGKKLDNADVNVRRRAAVELGKRGKGADVGALLAHLSDGDPETRLYIIEAADFLVDHDPKAAEAAASGAAAVDKQLADERGKSDYAKVNEDLRRLAARLHRRAPAASASL